MGGRYLNISGGTKKKARIKNFTAGLDSRYDESVMGLGASPKTYNFVTTSGVLKPGYGLAAFDRFGPVHLAAVWVFNRYDPELLMFDDRLMGLSHDGRVYECSAGGGTVRVIPGFTLSAPPSVTNYRLYGEDVVIMCTENDGMYVYNGIAEPYKVEGAPFITSLCLHYERLFVTVGGERNAVWFSDDLDPTNFNLSLLSGGFVELIDERGQSGRVVSFNNYVYVFREYGISRLTAYADQSEFSLSNLYVGGGKICFPTVTVCGDRVLFLASDGLYAFDGYNTTRIVKALDGVRIEGDRAAAAYAGGKYYLAFRSQADGEPCLDECGAYTNNMLLCYDVGRGSVSLSRGMDIVSLTAFKPENEVIAVLNSGRAGVIRQNGMYFDVPLHKKWRIAKTAFAAEGVKRLYELRFFLKGSCTVVLRNDDKEKRITLPKGNKMRRLRPAFSGQRIGIDFVSDAEECEIADVSFTVKY